MAENTNNTTQDTAKQPLATYEKKTLGKKIVDSLFSDKIDSMFSYISENIFWPSLRQLMYDLGNNALRIIFLGGAGGVSNSGPSGNYVPGQGWQTSGARREPFAYHNLATPAYVQPQIYTPPSGTDNVIIQTRDGANLILDRLRNCMNTYHVVRLADFYYAAEVTGQESNFALQASGWYDISGAQIYPTTDGRWIIKMPPLQRLSN